jgi:undecaprenyl-diphosphatase
MLNSLLLLFKSIIMGIVEGVTEFLPISSTGHMIIVGGFIRFSGAHGFTTEFASLFEVFIQFGAILAIVVLYRKKILESLKTLRPGGFGFKLWTEIILAMVPAGVVMAILMLVKHITHYDFLSKTMMQSFPVSIALLVGGIWMIYAERRYRKNETKSHLEKVTYKQALAIGIFQCISILWPGFSRSASTIIGGWVMGLATPTAAEFSFFLAIPAMFCASAGDLATSKIKLDGIEILALIVGFITAFFVALIVVKKFVEFLKHKPMKGFAIYRIIVGAVLIILALTRLM